MAFSLVKGINVAMARLVDIWDSIGIMEEQRVERMETVKQHIEVLLKDMVTEEEALKSRIKANIFTYQKQLENLSIEMSVDPYELEEGLTVLQAEKNLRLNVEALSREKADRLSEQNALQQKDKDLCVEMCCTPYYIPTGSLPSRTQLAELREHIHELTEEKSRRVAVFSDLRQSISQLMSEMGHEPETSLEKESVSADLDVFLLTHDNIKVLKQLRLQLEVKRDSLVKTVGELNERASCLWSRLLYSEEERRAFQQSVQGTLNDQITQWREEVERLVEQQRSRLEEVITKVRQELSALWDLCAFSTEQRESFNTHFCDDNFCEELLSVHDAELLKVQAYYVQAKPLLDTLLRWEKTWALFLEFERKASDPNRFSNRGGTLLTEGKERNKIQKTLPKLEEELRSGVALWQLNHGTDFLVKGQKVMTFISNHWEEHQQQQQRSKGKEKEKNEKATKKAETTPFKTPTKRAHGGVNGPTPSKIRKTPSHSAGHRTIVGSSSSKSSTFGTFISTPSVKAPVSTNVPERKRSSSSTSLKTPLQECNRETKPPTVPISYSDFTSDLSRKASDAVLNSTVKDNF